MQAAHVVPMPPVSECMRWQESVSDEFVRLMHSVLSTRKPNVSACLSGTLSIPVSLTGRAVLSDRYGIIAMSVYMANHRALVWSGQSDDRVRSARWADAVTLARASEALEHSHQRQGSCQLAPSSR